MQTKTLLAEARAEHDRIRKRLQLKTPLLTVKSMRDAIHEFARRRHGTPRFELPFEVGHTFLQRHLEHWMKNHESIHFTPEQAELLLALRGERHTLPEGHAGKQKRIEAAEKLLEAPGGRALYVAFQGEVMRLTQMSQEALQSLRPVSEKRKERQPRAYAAMFQNPLIALAMSPTLEQYRSLL